MSANDNGTPTISRVFEDGTLIDLLYDPAARTTALAVRDASGETSVRPHLELGDGERLVPYSADNNLIANACVLLPSDIGDVRDKGDVLEAVRAFLHRYVDLPPLFEEIAAHYVLLTWVYDAFSDLGYLRFRGDFGTGKTRALLTVGSLCYKAFFASGASTVSPIFHIQDAFQGTLILDEADFRFSDQTADLAKVLNNGTTRGLPVLRTMTSRHRELNPQAFRVFGPKIIAMREHFSDVALESRFLTAETSGREPRSDIPVHLPPGFADEARALRNDLLAWRLSVRHLVRPDLSRVADNVSPRFKQTSLALLSLVESPALREAICFELRGEEQRISQDRADTHDAIMIGAVLSAFAEAEGPCARVSEITERFNAQAAEDLGKRMTNRWVGGFLRNRLRLSTYKTGGVFVVPQTERAKVSLMAERFGVSA